MPTTRIINSKRYPEVTDYPLYPQESWLGYYNKKDKTVIPPNSLTAGTINCFIPDNDLIVTRAGSAVLGQAFTVNTPIIGHKKKFTNAYGLDLEVRAWASGGSMGDVLEVYYANSLTGVSQWWKITENNNPLTPSVARLGMRPHYYFDEWFDVNFDTSLSLQAPRLVGVNGTTQILSWTGGIGEITGLTSTTLSVGSSLTWGELGFFADDSGDINITVNGVAYTATDGLTTDTLTGITSTSGISVNDVAFQQIESDVAPIIFDYCSTTKNHVQYGNFQSRQLYGSNAFNFPGRQAITTTSVVSDNDLVLSQDSNYTGTGSHIYRVTIDSVTPGINTQEFIPSGQGGINDVFFDTSGYTGPAGITNIYKLVVTTDADVIIPTTIGTFLAGEVITGATSGASATVIAIGSATTPLSLLGVTNIQGAFENGEIVTGQSSGANGATSGASFYSRFNLYKNSTLVTNNDILTTATITAPDGINITVGSLYGHVTGDAYILTIQASVPDTYQWQIDGGIPVATFVPITAGTSVVLSDGITITFVSQTGHTVGDYWEITVNQEVTRGWSNFYYTVPNRLPGEGFLVTLPSNFWTEGTQEDVNYVNTVHGEWVFIEFQLASNLLTETVIVTPLKTQAQNKVIFPYMLSYVDNNIIYVTTNKTLDMIGRKKLVELPQVSSLSDPVKYDFLNVSFENGSMEFWDKKTWVVSPNEKVMFCFDWVKKYFQPPQVFPENGILTTMTLDTIESLVSHSSLRNQTNTLFVGTNDNGSAFTVTMRFAYNAYGNRWGKKQYNMTFIEGYMIGEPVINYRVYLDLNGCHGIRNHPISPIPCIPDDRASLGKAPFGAHGLGNDPTALSPYFQEIFKSTQNEFYFASIELSCETLDQNWSVLSVALNAIGSNKNNSVLTSNTINLP